LDEAVDFGRFCLVDFSGQEICEAVANELGGANILRAVVLGVGVIERSQ